MPRRKKSPRVDESRLPGLLWDCPPPKQSFTSSRVRTAAGRRREAEAAAQEASERNREQAAANGIAALERRLIKLREAPNELFQPLGSVIWLPNTIKNVQPLSHDQPYELDGPRNGLGRLGRWYTASGHTSFDPVTLDYRGVSLTASGEHCFCGLDKRQGWLLVRVLLSFEADRPVAQAVSCGRSDLPRLLQLEEGLTHHTLSLWFNRIEKELEQLQSEPQQRLLFSHHQVG